MIRVCVVKIIIVVIKKMFVIPGMQFRPGSPVTKGPGPDSALEK